MSHQTSFSYQSSADNKYGTFSGTSDKEYEETGGGRTEDVPLLEESDITEVGNPPIALLALFLLFLKFGFQAWGGPVAQIAMMKEQLVEKEQWISVEQFNRVLAVYQVLPGPEATELACYFGMVARGRIGSILAGLGFILPGLGMMLFLSWFYVEIGIDSVYVMAIFLGLQPAVAAIIFKAVHKIGESVFVNHKTKQFNEWLLCISLLAGIQQVMGINFFIILAWSGLEALFLIELPTKYQSDSTKRYTSYACAIALAVLGLAGYIVYVIFLGKPETSVLGSGVISGKEWYNLFLLGLLAGLLTFGGAYTAIPFVQQSAVISGKWLSDLVFLDGIAIASVLPAPLVIFNTFVGYIGGEFLGAFLMTLGVFLPAFSFTLIGHEFFEKMTQIPIILTVLDGVTAGAVGLIAVSGMIFAKTAITNIPSLLIFSLALGASYIFPSRITNMVIVVVAAIFGEVLFVNPTPQNITLSSLIE